MSARIVLRSDARMDVRKIVHWYESQRRGLGHRCLQELGALLDRIAHNPQQFPVIEMNVRRGLLHRFPYGVYFVLDSKRIEVIAVLHLHRHPNAWIHRSPEYPGKSELD